MGRASLSPRALLCHARGYDDLHGNARAAAQGGEAGGFGGFVSTMALVPQVVDAVSPIPVVAAGGIAAGRGLAAALALGGQGVNIGTRFLASEEVAISEAWKRAIVEAHSEEIVAGLVRDAERALGAAAP